MPTPAQSKNVLPVISLLFSITMLLATLISSATIFLQGRHIPYDAQLIPYACMGAILICLFAVGVAFVAAIVKTNWCSITSLLIAIVALVASVGQLLLLAMVMLANHPV